MSREPRAGGEVDGLDPFGGFDLLSPVRLYARDLEAAVRNHDREAIGFDRDRAEPTADGGLVWATVVKADGAGAIRLHVQDLSLPKDAALYVYGRDDQAYGPYTGFGPNFSGDFWTTAVFGTEAVLHRVRDADVVAFLDMDAELLAPRFRAAEQAMALLVRAARLVGPRADGGRIVVQTRLPRHEVLDAVLHADPDRLVAGERARRRALGFPPETALASVDGPGAPEYAAALRSVHGLVVSGQGPALVRARDWETLADGLAAVARPSGSRVRVEVDPPRI